MEPGTYILFVPPGWLLAVRVVSSEGDHLVCDGVVHLEGVASGHSTVSSLAVARGHGDVKAAITRWWRWGDGVRVLRSAALLSVPTVIDVGAACAALDAKAALR